jgi:hypothetical protein
VSAVLAAVLSASVSAMLTSFGWWFVNVVITPRQKVTELRQRASKEIVLYANIGKGSPEADLEAAVSRCEGWRSNLWRKQRVRRA